MNFNLAFDRLIGHEGGYVNDPNDPGGETNWGISKRAYPNVDIRSLTKDMAKNIYKRDYWDAARCDEYDGAIGFQLFDLAVNAGIIQAKMLLQRAARVAVDGQIGPITIAAIKKRHPMEIIARFNAYRLLFYTELSTWRHYGAGWTNRTAKNILVGVDDALELDYLPAPGT